MIERIFFYPFALILTLTSLNCFFRYTQIDQLFIPRKIIPLFSYQKLTEGWIYQEIINELPQSKPVIGMFLSRTIPIGLFTFNTYPHQFYQISDKVDSKILITTNEIRDSEVDDNWILQKRTARNFKIYKRR